jgi:hypothetical protein
MLSYAEQEHQKLQLVLFLPYNLLLSLLILSAHVLNSFLSDSIWSYGFFLGGAFNMLASNEVMAITKGDEQKVDMLSTLSMCVGNIFVGIVEIIIGLALNVKHDYSK